MAEAVRFQKLKVNDTFSFPGQSIVFRKTASGEYVPDDRRGSTPWKISRGSALVHLVASAPEPVKPDPAQDYKAVYEQLRQAVQKFFEARQAYTAAAPADKPFLKQKVESAVDELGIVYNFQ